MAEDAAEYEYQQRYSVTHHGNLAVTGHIDCLVGEKATDTDLTSYDSIAFGEGNKRVIVSGNSGDVVVSVPPASRIIVVPMNSGAVRIEAVPL